MLKDTSIRISNFKEKIDSILESERPEKEYLIRQIDRYYSNLKKKKPLAQIIEYDFKKREIIAFYEYLTEEDLGKNF